MKSPIVISIDQSGIEPTLTVTTPDQSLTAIGMDEAGALLHHLDGRTLWTAHAAQLELDHAWILEALLLPKLRCAMTVDRALSPVKHKPVTDDPTAVMEMLSWHRVNSAGTRAWDAAFGVDDEGRAWREAWRDGLKVDVAELVEILNEKHRIARAASIALKLDMLGTEEAKGAWLESIGCYVERTDKYGWAHPSNVGTQGLDAEGLEIFAIYKDAYSAQSRYGVLRGIQRRLDGDRVRPLVFMNGAATGRMAVRDPGIQALPGDVRHIIRPARPGDVFVSVDHSSAELKILARMIQVRFGDDSLASAVMETDPYQMLAEASGLPRKTTKLRLLAHLYGQRVSTMERVMGRDQAHTLLDALRALFPQIPAFQKDSEERAKRGERLETLTGRRLPSLDGGSYETRPQLATNYFIQGSARDAYGQGVRRAVAAFGAPALAVPVHDELIIQVPRVDATLGGAVDTLLEAMRIDLGGGVILDGKAKTYSDGWGRR